MDLIQGIKERRSVRKFKDTPIPREIIREIVEIASYAPSWKNTQTARYIVVDDRKLLEKIASEECLMGFAHNVTIIAKAPALVIQTIVKGRSGYEKDGSFSTSKEDKWEVFDAGIAAQTFCLGAHAKGLGTVIMGIFDEKKIGEIIELPQGQQIAALIAIGYPDEKPKAPARKTPEELLTFL